MSKKQSKSTAKRIKAQTAGGGKGVGESQWALGYSAGKIDGASSALARVREALGIFKPDPFDF